MQLIAQITDNPYMYILFPLLSSFFLFPFLSLSLLSFSLSLSFLLSFLSSFSQWYTVDRRWLLLVESAECIIESGCLGQTAVFVRHHSVAGGKRKRKKEEKEDDARSEVASETSAVKIIDQKFFFSSFPFPLRFNLRIELFFALGANVFYSSFTTARAGSNSQLAGWLDGWLGLLAAASEKRKRKKAFWRAARSLARSHQTQIRSLFFPSFASFLLSFAANNC